ncbi:lamin tail domain-containing protein, partial [bacterium]|nr:lamin tail domain-containing protein [bacterium]
PVNMKDFTLKDKANHIFTFPEFILNSNEIVKIYSGCGENNSTSLYWCSFGAIWNNDTDTAFLYDSNGNLIDTYNYP